MNVKSCLNLRSIFIKNGKKQTFGDNFSDCPNLKNICCDPSEVAHFSSNPNYTVVTDCSLLGSSEINGKENPILFFPNPADNAIYFKERVQSVSVFDLSGKLLKKVSLNDTKFQVSFLKKGTYILLIDHGKTTETRKLIKN